MTTTVRAGAVGHLEEFDPKNDTMAAYIERATFYMEANNVAEDKKTATFLTTLGKNTFQVLRNLVAPAKVGDKTFPEIAEVLLHHYEPKPLVISERFDFHRRQQGANETVADYVAELRVYLITGLDYWITGLDWTTGLTFDLQESFLSTVVLLYILYPLFNAINLWSKGVLMGLN